MIPSLANPGLLYLLPILTVAAFVWLFWSGKKKEDAIKAAPPEPPVVSCRDAVICPTCYVFHAPHPRCPQCGGGASFVWETFRRLRNEAMNHHQGDADESQ